MDDNLNWNDHITYVKNKISKIIAMLSQVKRNFPLPLKIMMFKGLLMPHLLYCLPIFGHSKQINTLLKCQKWALRTITKTHWKSHTDKIFLKFNILKIPDLYQLSVCTIIRKRISNYGPKLLQDIYEYKDRRNIHYITTTKSVSKRMDNFPNHLFPKIWNSHNKLDLRPTYHSYKSQLKLALLENYNTKCHKPNCFNCKVTSFK